MAITKCAFFEATHLEVVEDGKARRKRALRAFIEIESMRDYLQSQVA
jgi:hypothetical protein